jgi:hypothetical protein
MGKIEDLITTNVRTSLKSKAFQNWIEKEHLSDGGVILFNSSYFYREDKNSVKNSDFLSLVVGADNSLEYSEIGVSINTPFQINNDFKYYSKTNQNLFRVVPLSVGVQNQVVKFGKLSFVLIGEINQEPITKEFNHKPFTQIILDPTQKSDLILKEDDPQIIVIKDTDERIAMWERLENNSQLEGLISGQLPISLRDTFDKALNEIADCNIVVNLPEAGKISDHTLFDLMLNTLREDIEKYEDALNRCNGEKSKDSTAFYDILRISYNFEKDILTLVQLALTLCDLKPIILWSTLNAQLDLVDCFHNLPWANNGIKPSLSSYKDTIEHSRNREFHKLLPFTRTVEVSLEGMNLKAKRLVLFPEYSGARGKGVDPLDYEDRELVKILSKLTHTKSQVTTPGFWQQNLMVMKSTLNFLDSVCGSLKLLCEEMSRSFSGE